MEAFELDADRRLKGGEAEDALTRWSAGDGPFLVLLSSLGNKEPKEPASHLQTLKAP